MGLSFDTEGEPAGGGGAGADGGADGGEGAPTPGAGGGTEDQPGPKVFDEAYVKQLRAEAASYRTELRETGGQFEGPKTACGGGAITGARGDTIAAYERENARREAAEAAGLPLSFADRLQGETAEELLADAKAFAEALPKPAPAKSTGPISGGLDPTEQPDAGPKDVEESVAKYGPRANRLI